MGDLSAPASPGNAIDFVIEEVRKATKARTKDEAVRLELQNQLAETRRTLPLNERPARSKALADAMGASDPAFDMKQYSDEMWDNA